MKSIKIFAIYVSFSFVAYLIGEMIVNIDRLGLPPMLLTLIAVFTGPVLFHVLFGQKLIMLFAWLLSLIFVLLHSINQEGKGKKYLYISIVLWVVSGLVAFVASVGV